MTLRYLSPHSEFLLCHYNLSLSKDGGKVFAFSCVCIMISIIFALRSEIIPIDNFDLSILPPEAEELHSENPDIRKFHEALRAEKIAKDHAKKADGMLRVGYGTNWEGYCWPDNLIRNLQIKEDGMVVDKWIYNETLYLPSPLRVMELNAGAQSALRLSITVTTALRMVSALLRGQSLLILSASSNIIIRYSALILPFVVALEGTFAFWLASLTQIHDEDVIFLMPFVVLLFGIIAFTHMLIYIIQDAVNRKKIMITSPIFIIRCMCLFVFVGCYSTVINNWLPFFRIRKCHSLVPWTEALPEYVCCLALFIFNALSLFDLPNSQMILCPLMEEITQSTNTSELYSPVFQKEIDTVEWSERDTSEENCKTVKL